MKFINNTDLLNQSKEIKRALTHDLNSSIEELPIKYDFDKEILDTMSYSFFVTHNAQVNFKNGKTKFTKAYEKSVIKLINESDLDWEDLGFLMHLSSRFTNYEDNYLRIDDELATKNELIECIIKEGKGKKSANSVRRRFKAVEDMNLLMSEVNPKNKKEKYYYLSPFLFYKGKKMSEKSRNALIKVYRDIYNELKVKVDNGELDIELNKSFDKMSDEELLLMATNYKG